MPLQKGGLRADAARDIKIERQRRVQHPHNHYSIKKSIPDLRGFFVRYDTNDRKIYRQ